MEPKELINQTIYNYSNYHNPSLARLLKIAGYGTVEWEGAGALIKDIEGREYIDCAGGYGVFSLGHAHPEVVEAVKKQLDRLPLSSKLFFNAPLGELAKLLAEITPGDLQFSFFCNSGAEAVEGAIKIARLSTGKPKIISAINSFHGKTFGALSATGREVFKEGFEPLLPQVEHIPFGDAEALAKVINRDDTAAVILEPIQGEGGIVVPPPQYWLQVRELCDEYGVLLIADEVQTGLGRTGKMFAVEHFGVVPDILTLAKALGGGVMPIGAFIATPVVWECFKKHPLIHTTTFGGGEAACVAAITTIKIILRDSLPQRAYHLGEYLLSQLKSISKDAPEIIKEVRGKGLMIGVELTKEAYGGAVIYQMAKQGVTAGYTLNNPKVIRFEPPLIITKEQLDRVIEVFHNSILGVRELFSQDAGGEMVND